MTRLTVQSNYKRQAKALKCLILKPGAQKNLSVIESHTTDNF